jgi:Protein of unknown function (DUF3667)
MESAVTNGAESAAGAGTAVIADYASAQPSAPCLNCGAALAGAFCSACGQKASVHRSLGAFWHDFTHSIFHFEGKIWRTLPMLAIKPGALTRRYIHGERARFVSPLALFLFSVFLMFASFNQFGVPIGPNSETKRNGNVIDRAEIGRELSISREKLKALETKRAAAARAGQSTSALDKEISSERENQSGLQMGYDLSDGVDANDLIKIDGADEFGNDVIAKPLAAKLKKGLENPSLLMYKVQSNAYKFSWLLIPLSLPFLWLLFAWKREYKIFDHLVFITYSLCAVTLLLAMSAVFSSISFLEAVAVPMLIFLPPVHMYLQLKGAYRLSSLSSIWRTIFMQTAAVIVIVLFSLILFALGLAG